MSDVKVHTVEQGSAEWLLEREACFCASDAPAMMGVSKHKSRRALLHEKKTGQREEVDTFTQARFDKGHETEASARKIVELDLFEDLRPAVVSREIDGLMLMASLDGCSEDGFYLFEHKLWNETLVANIKKGVLEPSYYWQLEQQLMISEANQVIFVCSDGTADKMVQMIYQSTVERRSELIAGWKQFAKDLESYEPEAIVEVVTGITAETFPLVKYKVEGSQIISNIAQVLPAIKERAEIEMNRVLETDQDFADKELMNKAVVAARASIKQAVADVTGEFVSYSEFATIGAEIDSVLQKMQSSGEKAVKLAKDAKKESIKAAAKAEILAYLDDCSKVISPLNISGIIEIDADFTGAMKNKRTLESLKDAVDGVVASAKIEIDAVMARVVPNQVFVRAEAVAYKFLFSDLVNIINQAAEPFQAIVRARIAAHKQEEKQKDEDRRAVIREEERVLAEKQAKEQANLDKLAESAKEPAKVAKAAKVADAVQVDTSVPETEEFTGVHIEEQPAYTPKQRVSLRDSLESWCKKHSIKEIAFDDLIEILEVHNVVGAK